MTDDDKEKAIFKRELREVAAELQNLITLEEAYTTNLEFLISTLDEQRTKRNKISS